MFESPKPPIAPQVAGEAVTIDMEVDMQEGVYELGTVPKARESNACFPSPSTKGAGIAEDPFEEAKATPLRPAPAISLAGTPYPCGGAAAGVMMPCGTVEGACADPFIPADDVATTNGVAAGKSTRFPTAPGRRGRSCLTHQRAVRAAATL